MAIRRPIVNISGVRRELPSGDTLPSDALGTINPVSGFQAHKNGTDQNFTTAVDAKVTFGTEVFDINNEFASDRFTVISGGKYWISVAAHITAFGVGTTSTKLMLYKNGALFRTMVSFVLTDMTVNIGLIVDVVDGDYFEVFIQFVGLASGTATIEGDGAETWFNGIRHASSPGNETTTSLGNLTNAAIAKNTPVDADMISLMDSATSNIWKKLSWANLKATLLASWFAKSKENQSVSAQGAGFATDTYLVGSNITLPSTIKIGTRYYLVFDVTKTGAGTATPIITVRIGTAGTTADTARLTFTFLAQTAVADTGRFEFFITFRTVGSGTTAVIQGTGGVIHSLAATGLQNLAAKVLQVTSGGFDSTVANLILGVSVNGGASAAWTVQLVQASLSNFD